MICYSLHANCSESVQYLASPYLVLHFHRGFSLDSFLLPFLPVPHELSRSVITTVLHMPLPYCSSSFCCAFSFLFGRLCGSSLTPQPLHCPTFHRTLPHSSVFSFFDIFTTARGSIKVKSHSQLLFVQTKSQFFCYDAPKCDNFGAVTKVFSRNGCTSYVKDSQTVLIHLLKLET